MSMCIRLLEANKQKRTRKGNKGKANQKTTAIVHYWSD